MHVDEDKKHRDVGSQILSSMGVTKEYFKDGNIKIDKSTCKGLECRLCIKACPTNALYWVDGEVKIEKDLCIHCCSCVLSCIVDNCIQVTRKREDGRIEEFSTPRDVILLCRKIASEKRREVTKKRFYTKLVAEKTVLTL